MGFLQREIARAHCCDGVLRCVDARGRPVAGTQVALRQKSAALRVGARVSEETRGALPLLARLASDVFLTPPVSRPLADACAERRLRATYVLPAPTEGEGFAAWRERVRAAGGGDGGACALDVAGVPASGPVLEAAIAFLRDRTGGPVCLLGLPLPLPSAISAADGYGVSLGAPRDRSRSGNRWNAASLRRALLAAAGRLEGCLVHGLHCPPPQRAFRSAAWELGGAERVQADALAEMLTVCFSVSGIRGLFFDPFVDPPSDPATPGLLAPDLRPKRAYKVARALLAHEWRTRLRGATDADGRFAWRGFHGVYEVTVRFPGGSVSTGERTLAAAAEVERQIVVPDS